MKKGIVSITNAAIGAALGFPPEWEIENISQKFSSGGAKVVDLFEILISGPDFPETNNRGDAEDVELIFHYKESRVEVKKR